MHSFRKLLSMFAFGCCLFAGITHNAHSITWYDEPGELWIEYSDLPSLYEILNQHPCPKRLIIYAPENTNQKYPLINPKSLEMIFDRVPKISELSFCRVSIVLDEALLNTLTNCLRFLTSVQLIDCCFDDNFLAQLPKSVEILLLEGQHITDDHLSLVPPTVRELVLNTCPSITARGLARLNTFLPRLRIYHCQTLTRSCISVLPREIEHLTLKYNPNLIMEDADIKNLPPTLTILNFDHWYSITKTGYATLPQNLQILVLAGCLEFPTDILQLLRTSYPGLIIESTM